MKKVLVFILVLSLSLFAFAGSTSTSVSITDGKSISAPAAPSLKSWSGWGG